MITKKESHMTGVICAMEIEMKNIREGMTVTSEKECAGVKFVEGKKFGKDIVVAVCGVGKVFAAICTQTMIDYYKPDIILNVGVAGGLSSSLDVKDVVIADQLIQHDMDATALGCKKGEIYGEGTSYRYFPANAYVIDRIKESAEIVNSERKKAGREPLRIFTGTVASGDLFVSDKEKKAELRDEFQAMACEMEGAAIAQVCCVNKVRFGVIRAISDSADEGSKMDFGVFCKEAADNSAELVDMFIKRS